MSNKELEKIFKALANRRRLAILKLLKVNGELTVGEVAKRIKLSFPATSRHLVKMERSGILEKEQRDKQVFYRLALPPKAFVGAFFLEL